MRRTPACTSGRCPSASVASGTVSSGPDSALADPADRHAGGPDGDAAHLLADLDEAQRLAVTTPAAPLCIRAGPGSGKTRVLTRRIAYRIATADCEARFSVAVTFTQRAAAELRARLAELGIRDRVAVGTFHGLAARQLRRHAEDDGRSAPDILADPSRLLGDLLRGGESPHALQAELDWCAAQSVRPADYAGAAAAAGRRPPLAPGRLAALLTAYEHKKRRLGLADFGDLLRLAAERLEGDPTTAEAWRWSRRHFFVDELQDLNPAQLRLLRAWLGDRSDLCAVGDPDQAIFGWSGADRRILDDFAELFAGATVVDLRRNYRCSPAIVALSAVLRDEGIPSGTAARPGEATPDPFSTPAPLIVAYPDEVAEVAGVARAVRGAQAPGDRWSAQAVLVRTRRQVAAMSKALESAGVPVRVSDPDVAADPGDRDAVCVSTMHAAKGLEWPVVHVAGLEEGLVPVAGAERGRSLDEEKRLLYVALTRARRHLHLSWAQQRDTPGQPAGRRPCRWLAGLEKVDIGDATAPRHEPGVRPAGRPPPPMGTPAEPLVAALSAWREQVAKAARVAPAAVISDRDVAAIVASRPATITELGIVTDLGASRLDRLGQELLAIIAEHAPTGGDS
ncbi:MAG: ATP-dependent DNA helicase UvrD2 [Acidimicrobiia bacterium]|nr:ATP-dependent DNA helicase UvrD2 [Acidimicrobiia bacterium]